MATKTLIKCYSRQYRQVYEGPAWFGESYLEKLGKIEEETAFKKPQQHFHSIAELLSHAIYWRKALITVLKGGEYTASVKNEGNWLSNEPLKEDGWEKLKNELAITQQKILHLLEPLNDEELNREFRDKQPLEYLVAGVIHHDIYHLGQMGLVIKLA